MNTSLPRPVKRQIRLAMPKGSQPLEVAAEVYSDRSDFPALALHKCRYGWDISHVRTGLQIQRVIGAKALALRVLASLLANVELGGWNQGEFDDGSDHIDHDALFEAARPALWVAYAIQFPGDPLPAYRTRAEQRTDYHLAARKT